MPKKFDADIRAKAVRLVAEHVDDYASEYEAIRTVAGRLGMNPETLRAHRPWLTEVRHSGRRIGHVTGTRSLAVPERREVPSTLKSGEYCLAGSTSKR